MPEIVKTKTTYIYNVDEVKKFIVDDLHNRYFTRIEIDDVKEIYTGGVKECDCAAWGDTCHHPTTPLVLTGFKIVTD